MVNTRRIGGSLVLLTAAAVAVAACSGDDTGNAAPSDGGGTDATLGADGSPRGSDGSTPPLFLDGASDAPLAADRTAPPVDAAPPPPPPEPLDAGALACDAGYDSGLFFPCWLSMPLSGALSTTLTSPQHCGAGGIYNFAWGVDDAQTGVTRWVTFGFAQGIPAGTIGTLTVDDVSLREERLVDAAPVVLDSWSASNGPCTITLTEDACSPTPGQPQRRILSGTGHCTKPLLADADASASPITIGDFVFTVDAAQ